MLNNVFKVNSCSKSLWIRKKKLIIDANTNYIIAQRCMNINELVIKYKLWNHGVIIIFAYYI